MFDFCGMMTVISCGSVAHHINIFFRPGAMLLRKCDNKPVMMDVIARSGSANCIATDRKSPRFFPSLTIDIIDSVVTMHRHCCIIFQI